MLNKIRRWICAPLVLISGIIFGLLVWLAYGKDNMLEFCAWLDGQSSALNTKDKGGLL